MPVRMYHWKHGWIPLDHTAALSKAKGSEHSARQYLADSHAAGHAHESVVAGRYAGGTHIRGLQPVAAEHLPRARHITAAFNPDSRRFSLHDARGDVTGSLPEHIAQQLEARKFSIAAVTHGGQRLTIRTPNSERHSIGADGTDLHTIAHARAQEHADRSAAADAEKARNEADRLNQSATALHYGGSSAARVTTDDLQKLTGSSAPHISPETKQLAQAELDRRGYATAQSRLSSRSDTELAALRDKIRTSEIPAHEKAGAEKYISERLAPEDLRKLSDDDIVTRLSAADDAEAKRIVAELDRRDAVARRGEAAKAAREQRDAKRDADYTAAVDAGEDPENAYARIYGHSVLRQRTDTAIASLRAGGYQGAGFHALTSAAYRDHVEQAFRDAEDATRGHLFKPGKTGDPRRLFNSSESYARANASEELLRYWNDHGRLTLDDFRQSLLGGRIASRGKTWH